MAFSIMVGMIIGLLVAFLLIGAGIFGFGVISGSGVVRAGMSGLLIGGTIIVLILALFGGLWTMSFTYFLAKGDWVPFGELFKKSFNFMLKNLGSLLKVYLMSVFLSVLGIMLFGIGIFYFGPLALVYQVLSLMKLDGELI